MTEIEYFYSAHSAFAYLGSARLSAIAGASGRKILHWPVDLDRVLESAGSVVFRERPAAHGAYFFGVEIARWSEFRAAPVMQGLPTHHREGATLANRMIVAGVLAGIDVDALAHGMLESHWRDDANLADTMTLRSIAAGAGYDADLLLDAAGTDATGAAYDANVALAVERSVFGSPTYFVDGEMFYGQDRLELLEWSLGRRGAVS